MFRTVLDIKYLEGQSGFHSIFPDRFGELTQQPEINLSGYRKMIEQPASLLVERGKTMKISARNQLRGTITAIKPGLVTAKVTIDIGGGNSISAVITTDSVEEMDLKPGDEVVAIIKSTEVMIGRE